jgi:hypothetical protein
MHTVTITRTDGSTFSYTPLTIQDFRYCYRKHLNMKAQAQELQFILMRKGYFMGGRKYVNLNKCYSMMNQYVAEYESEEV